MFTELKRMRVDRLAPRTPGAHETAHLVLAHKRIDYCWVCELTPIHFGDAFERAQSTGLALVLKIILRLLAHLTHLAINTCAQLSVTILCDDIQRDREFL